MNIYRKEVDPQEYQIQLSSLHLQEANVLIQILLAIIGIGYIHGTNQVRRQTVAQLRLLEDQTSAAVTPYLVFRIKTCEKEDLSEIDDAFECTVYNPSQNLAIDVDLYLYDSKRKHFRRGNAGKPVISKADDEVTISISGPPIDGTEVIKKAQTDTGATKDGLAELLVPAEHSYAVVFFHDINGGIYRLRRRFNQKADGSVTMGRGVFKKLIRDPSAPGS